MWKSRHRAWGFGVWGLGFRVVGTWDMQGWKRKLDTTMRLRSWDGKTWKLPRHMDYVCFGFGVYRKSRKHVWNMKWH